MSIFIALLAPHDTNQDKFLVEFLWIVDCRCIVDNQIRADIYLRTQPYFNFRIVTSVRYVGYVLKSRFELSDHSCFQYQRKGENQVNTFRWTTPYACYLVPFEIKINEQSSVLIDPVEVLWIDISIYIMKSFAYNFSFNKFSDNNWLFSTSRNGDQFQFCQTFIKATYTRYVPNKLEKSKTLLE